MHTYIHTHTHIQNELYMFVVILRPLTCSAPACCNVTLIFYRFWDKLPLLTTTRFKTVIKLVWHNNIQIESRSALPTIDILTGGIMTMHSWLFLLAGVDWHWLVKWLLTGDREINRNYYRRPVADVQARNEGNTDLWSVWKTPLSALNFSANKSKEYSYSKLFSSCGIESW
jgi:hypothetical protein